MVLESIVKKVLFQLVVLVILAVFSSGCAHFSSTKPDQGNAGVNAPERVPAESLRRQTLLNDFKIKNSKKIKVAFFDADSTLRISKSGSVSANSQDDVLILPNVPEKLEELARDGYFIAIVSNQGGIEEGHITHAIADGALFYTVRLIELDGGKVHYFDYAESKDKYRKPEVGMFERLEVFLKERLDPSISIDIKKSFMVGDSAYKKPSNNYAGDKRPDGTMGTHFSNSDRLFAKNLKIKFYEPTDFFGWRKYGVDVIENATQLYSLRKKIENQN